MKLWKENKLENEFEMTFKEIENKFNKSQYSIFISNEEDGYIPYFEIFDKLEKFIRYEHNDGLNSSCEPQDLKELADIIYKKINN